MAYECAVAAFQGAWGLASGLASASSLVASLPDVVESLAQHLEHRQHIITGFVIWLVTNVNQIARLARVFNFFFFFRVFIKSNVLNFCICFN